MIKKTLFKVSALFLILATSARAEDINVDMVLSSKMTLRSVYNDVKRSISGELIGNSETCDFNAKLSSVDRYYLRSGEPSVEPLKYKIGFFETPCLNNNNDTISYLRGYIDQDASVENIAIPFEGKAMFIFNPISVLVEVHTKEFELNDLSRTKTLSWNKNLIVVGDYIPFAAIAAGFNSVAILTSRYKSRSFSLNNIIATGQTFSGTLLQLIDRPSSNEVCAYSIPPGAEEFAQVAQLLNRHNTSGNKEKAAQYFDCFEPVCE